MIKKEINILGLHHQILKFLKEHEKDYTDSEKEFILKNYAWGMRSSLVPDILRQIYDELNLLEDNKNIYNGFLDLLDEHFDINQNIVEIGGGNIPSLGKKLASRQKKGSVTVYDDKLITTNTNVPNLTLIKRRLSPKEELPKADMIIGFMPCEGTETAIHLAQNNKLDFMIAFCKGSCHNEALFSSSEDWELSMLYEARNAASKAGLGTVEKIYMKEYQNPYPVIYNKRQ